LRLVRVTLKNLAKVGLDERELKEGTMSQLKVLKFGFAGAAVALALTACASRDDVASLDSRVETLENRLSAAESKNSQLQSAVNQCTTTCEAVQEKQTRMEQTFQQSMRK
jgi:septal ring factor EnvC (AmiA/AmiB activator)